MTKRCGFVAVLGETNAGKSTLINYMVGQKVSIVSRKIQTTIFRILGIALYEESQIIFVDTPGFLHSSRSSVKSSAESLAKISWNALYESEHILFLIDVNKKNFESNIALLKNIPDEKKVSLTINKIDLVKKTELLKIAEIFSSVRNFENIFMISAKTGSGVKDILKYFSSVIPEKEWIYDEEETTDLSFEKYVAEITREHIFHRLHKEIPYKCEVETSDYQELPDNSIKINQNIHVKSNAHKVICLGHKGGKIKAIGEAARRELSQLLDRKVHLFLQVLVDEKRS